MEVFLSFYLMYLFFWVVLWFKSVVVPLKCFYGESLLENVIVPVLHCKWMNFVGKEVLGILASS